jgi:hypothetical protein
VSPGKPRGFPGVLGLATWNYGNFTYPDLKVTTAKQADNTYNATVDATTATDAATSAVATPQGVHVMGGTTVDPGGSRVRLKNMLGVSAAAAGQITAAEQEHLDDVTQAFTITIKAAADVVNGLGGQIFNDAKKADAIKAAKKAVKDGLDPKLGDNPRTWRSMLRTCASLTVSGRDRSRWHTFDSFADASDIDLAAKTITYQVLPNPNVGTTSSATLIVL